MAVKGGFVFSLFIYLVILPASIRSVDIDETRPAQALRLMKQLQRYYNVAPKMNLDEVIQRKYAKFLASPYAKRKRFCYMKQAHAPNDGSSFLLKRILCDGGTIRRNKFFSSL